jgi:NADH-quinone oxidoreductase subunit A
MTALVAYILLFTFVGFFFVFFHLMLGRLVRPVRPNPEKLAIYECGEPTVGSSWVQFDLRYYVIALLFVIFDVEVVFFFPWAVVFGKLNSLGDTSLTAYERSSLTLALDPTARAGQQIAAEDATALAWIAFVDILVFFGFLIVGYAYLWRRGDLDWVRSTAAERVDEQVSPRPPPEVSQPALAGTLQS